MIRCPKCQEENMIGVIFCRGCGDKLDIDNISPDDVAKTAKKSNVGNIIRQSIGVLVLLAIAALLVGLFLKPPYTEVTTLEDEALQRAQNKQRQFMESPVETDVEFTIEEFMSLVRIELGLTPELVDKDAEKRAQEGTTVYLIPMEYHIDVTGENTFNLVLKSQFTMFDNSVKLPVYTTLNCRLVAADGKMNLEVTDAAMGRIPMLKIEPAVEKMKQRHLALSEYNEPVQDFFKAVKSATITPTKVSLRRKGSATPE